MSGAWKNGNLEMAIGKSYGKSPVEDVQKDCAALIKFASENQIMMRLGEEFYRLRQLDIVPDVADVMEIVRPFLK